MKKPAVFLMSLGILVGVLLGHEAIMAQVIPGSPFGGGSGAGVPSPLTSDLYGGTSSRCFFTDSTSTFSATTSEGICPNSTTGTTNLYGGNTGYIRGLNASVVQWKLEGATGLTLGASDQARWATGEDTEGAVDAGIARQGAQIVKSTDGGAGFGWFFNTGGRSRLTTDYTNATASFTNTSLVFNLTNGVKYTFRLALMFGDSTAADGAQFDFNGGSATMSNFRASCTAANAAGADLVLTNGATTSIATAVQVALALTTQAVINCVGIIEPSSTNTFTIRAAQTAHSTGTLTIFSGSYAWLEVTP